MLWKYWEIFKLNFIKFNVKKLYVFEPSKKSYEKLIKKYTNMKMLNFSIKDYQIKIHLNLCMVTH